MSCRLGCFLLLALATVSYACSPEGFPDSLGFDYTMYNADVVVSGKTLKFSNDSHDVLFSVDCIYKHGLTTNVFTETITIDGRYYFNSCTTTYLKLNQTYIIALENMFESQKYNVYEPNIASKGAYELSANTDTMLKNMVKMCGFEDVTQGEAVSDATCEKPMKSEGETCIKSEPSSQTGRASSITASAGMLLSALVILVQQ